MLKLTIKTSGQRHYRRSGIFLLLTLNIFRTFYGVEIVLALLLTLNIFSHISQVFLC